MSRAFRGNGVLAIWNGIAPEAEQDFLRWHVGQHLPERISVPGFLRARRYVALEGTPAYFNFYEVEDVGVLSSPAYLERLDAPTDWTQSVVPHFTDTSRTLCAVVESRGHGCGGVILTLRLDADAAGLRPLVRRLADHPDICAATLLSRYEEPVAPTSESRMRSSPDASSQAILLIEGPAQVAIAAAADKIAPEAELLRLCGAVSEARGFYQLDFMLD